MSSRRSRTISVTRRKSIVRASVYDVCLEIGALDGNNQVAEWMFGEGVISTHGHNRTTRFEEAISVNDGEQPREMPRRRRLLSFIIKAPTFTSKLLCRAKSRTRANRVGIASSNDQSLGTGRVSLNRHSFFRRSMIKPARTLPPVSVEDPTFNERPNLHNGRRSMRPVSFFQRRLQRQHVASSVYSQDSAVSISATLHHVPELEPVSTHNLPDIQIHNLHDIPENDSDGSWEQLEAIPGSPRYPLHNRGINPPALLSVDKKIRASIGTDGSDRDGDAEIHHGFIQYNFAVALPRLVSLRRRSRADRGTPSIRSKTSLKSPSISSSLQSSPRKALSRIMTMRSSHSRTPSGESLPPTPFVLLSASRDSPEPTSRIVFTDDEPLRPSLRPSEQEGAMGYHHQFFEGQTSVPFPTMQVD